MATFFYFPAHKSMKNTVIIILLVIIAVLWGLFYESWNSPLLVGPVGDSREDSSGIVMGNIIGKWQSLDDVKFTRTFWVNGTVTDSYTEGWEIKGTWNTAPWDSGFIRLNFPFERYLRYVGTVYPVETTGISLRFQIEKLTPETLEMTYLEGGNVLRFSKSE